MRTSGAQTTLLASPVYTGQAQGEENRTKIGAKGLGVSLSLSPTHWGALLFASLGQHALTPPGRIFLLFSK